MRLSIIVTLSFAALAASACSSDPAATPELADAQSKFADANLTSYSFTWTQGCFCGDDRSRATRVTVRNGAIASALYVDDGTPSKNPDIRTIDGLFALIQRGYDQHYDTVRVTYDPQLGYPTMVFFDPVKNAADEETQLGLTDFVTPADNPAAVR